ncbi:hypothetical protein CRYUN_Cryun18bG0087000 [Craigia yunnanensis]
MANKKSSTNCEVEVVEGQPDLAIDNTVLMPYNKKIKTDNKIDAEMGGGVAAPSVPSSIKPMERKKKRKQTDKERQRSVLQNEESQPKQMNVESKGNDAREPVASSSTSDLPEFHISGFKDLASADSSVREAAVKTMVTELQEVYKAYDRLENKDLVEGGFKLEALKDDGLDNCASSLRYAVRRLIRGVSSSRECARQGFALGLTALVATIPSIKVDSLLKLIEVRDCLLGRLFAYGALARSDRLTKEWFYDKDTLHIKEFMSALISLAAKKKKKRCLQEYSAHQGVYECSYLPCCKKKRYLQESAVSIILEIVEKAKDAASVSNSLKSTKRVASLALLKKKLQRTSNVSVRLPSSFIPMVLTYKLVQCLIDILSTIDSWLYNIAQHFLKELLDLVRNDDVRRIAVIVAFQKHSNGKFDCITKMKTVKDMMAEFKTETGCMLFVQNLINLFLDEGHVSEEPSDQSQTTDENSEIGSIEDKDSIGIVWGMLIF